MPSGEAEAVSVSSIHGAAHLPPVLPVQRTSATAPREEGRARVPSKSSGSMHQQLSMSDDLSALVATLARRRADGRGSPDPDASAWADRVLEDDAPGRFAQLRVVVAGLVSPEDIRAALLGSFPDPSDAVLVLRMLADELGVEDGRRDLLLRLADALLEESPRNIRAGINAAAESRAFARRSRRRRPRLARELRQTYRHFLASDVHATFHYEEWFTDYGFDDRHLVLDFLENAVGADMYSLDPSCSRLEFGNVLRRVRELCTLRSADGILLQQAWDPEIMPGLQVEKETLLRSLFKVVRNGGSMRPLFDGAFAHARLVLDNNSKGRLVRRVTGALRALPRELWENEEYLIEAIAGLDQLADRLHRTERENDPRQVAVSLR